MSINDLNNLKDILYTKFDEFWNYNILKEEIENQNSYFIVAKSENETIVGFAGIKVILDEADIMNIVVHKDFRNKKIGSQLLEQLLLYSKQNNIKSINLEVNELNSNAIALYKKFGFKQIAIRKKYYNDNDAIIMKKEIETQ
jgi:ribosomal-protein-alanine N-acetyltransferase